MFELKELVPWLALAVSGILIPIALQYRREDREERSTLHKSVTEIQGQVHQIAVSVAVLRERDRIAELLDKRLPKE